MIKKTLFSSFVFTAMTAAAQKATITIDVNNPIGTRKSIFVNCKWLNIRDLHFRNCFTEKNVFLDDTKNTSA